MPTDHDAKSGLQIYGVLEMSWIEKISSIRRHTRPSTELKVFVDKLSNDAVAELSTGTVKEMRAPTALALLSLRCANGYAEVLENALRGMRKSQRSDRTDFHYNAVMFEAVAFAVFCCMSGFLKRSDRFLDDNDPEEVDEPVGDGYFESLKYSGGIAAGILKSHDALKDVELFTNLLGGYSATVRRNDDVVDLFVRRVIVAIGPGDDKPFAPAAVQAATVGWDWAQFKEDMRVYYENFVSATSQPAAKR
ncbi:hypothetical protein ACV229_26590 [Burkholderia sp. MR1-5-21]